MNVIEYPFPGCCEHTPNAHGRRHCHLCDCEKQPYVQAGPPPTEVVPPKAPLPPEPQMTWERWADVVFPEPQIDVKIFDDLSICPRCGCLVDAQVHDTWTGCPPVTTPEENPNG